MSDQSAYLRSRIYVLGNGSLHSPTGLLRHIASSPENAYFVADPDIWKSRPVGSLAQMESNSFRPIARLANHMSASATTKTEMAAQEIALSIVELERGLVGLEADGVSVCGGRRRIHIVEELVQYLGILLAVEDWCSQQSRDARVPKSDFNINRRLLQSFIVDPKLRAAARRVPKTKSYSYMDIRSGLTGECIMTYASICIARIYRRHSRLAR